MKRLLKYLQIDKYFILFIFIISYVFVVNIRIRLSQKLDMVFLPDGPIAQFISAFIIFISIKVTINYMSKKYAKEVNNIKDYLKYFGIALVLYICASNMISLIISTIFDNLSRNFTVKILISVNNLLLLFYSY